jgi:L-asparaginase
MLLDRFADEYREMTADTEVDFQTEEPYRILSENMNGTYLNLLAGTIEKVLARGDSDGVIITHGTDTLQYTAAVLGYLFGTQGIPVVLVSSDYPLEDARANGLENFAYAVDFITHRYGSGVYVSYKNPGGNPKIHRATRLLPHMTASSLVFSIADSYFGEYEGKKFIYNSSYTCVKKGDISGEVCYNRMTGADGGSIRLSENAPEILWIHPYVGMCYPKITGNDKAVLLDSYHSGTIGISKELHDFMDDAGKQKIPVFLYGLPLEEHAYETVKSYEQMGIQVLPEMSGIAAYCKLWLALCGGLDLSGTMNSVIAEDCIFQMK